MLIHPRAGLLVHTGIRVTARITVRPKLLPPLHPLYVIPRFTQEYLRIPNSSAGISVRACVIGNSVTEFFMLTE